MTRKTRRSKPADDPEPQAPPDSKPRGHKAPRPAETKRREPAPASSAQSKEAEPPATGEPAGVSLPAFGFAEDLLGKSTAAAPREPAGAAAAAAATDPRRIFRFADSLEQAAAEKAAAAAVRLETWVAFSLAGEVYALPVEPVREVVRVASITRVPHAPSPVRGVTNMRGRVIPVIDLRLRIELPEAKLGRASRVVVVSSRRRLLGLLVDAVHQVIHIDSARIQPPPDDVMTVRSDYLCGVYHLDDQIVLLLDIDRALIIRDAEAEATDAPAAEARTASGAAADVAGGTGADDAPAETA